MVGRKLNTVEVRKLVVYVGRGEDNFDREDVRSTGVLGEVLVGLLGRVVTFFVFVSSV